MAVVGWNGSSGPCLAGREIPAWVSGRKQGADTCGLLCQFCSSTHCQGIINKRYLENKHRAEMVVYVTVEMQWIHLFWQCLRQLTIFDCT